MRILGIIGFLLTSLTVASGQVPGSSFPVPNMAVSPSGSLPFTPQQVFNVGDYGAVGNGSTDDTVAINAALTACSTQGGGQVVFAYKQYLVNTANLTVPQGCTLGNQIWVGDERNGSPANNLKAVPALLLNPSFTVSVSNGGAVDGIAIINSALSPPTTWRTAISGVASFSGTAITSVSSGYLSNLYIVGFNQCISENGQRFTIQHVRGDCINGIAVQNETSKGFIDDIEFWPFYYQNNTFAATNSYSITGAVASGSNIQVTIGAGSIVQANDIVSINGVGGYTGANNRWTVTSIDGSGNVILSGSVAAPTPTGTWSSGAKSIVVSSVASLAIGQTVTGTNIAASSTISYVDVFQKVIYLNNATTGSGSGTTLTIGNNAYTSGGTLTVNPQYAGHGIDLTHVEGMSISNVLDEEHDFGVYLTGSNSSGYSTYWAKLTDVSCDTSNPADPATACVYLAGTGGNPVMGLSWIGGYCSSVGTCFYSDAQISNKTAAVNTIVGVHFAVNQTTLLPISIKTGSVSIIGSDINNGGITGTPAVYVADTVAVAIFSSDNFSAANLIFNTVTGKALTYVDPTTLFNNYGGTNGAFSPIWDATTVAFGQGAFGNPQTLSGQYFNTFIGNLTGSGAITSAGVANTGVGYKVMPALTSGVNNFGGGNQALLALTTGQQNTCVGTTACSSITTVNVSSAFGYDALKNATGAGNAAFGANAGLSITGGAGNLILGTNVAQTTLAGGSRNIIIGTASTCDAANAGDNDTFVLCSSTTSTPLMSGSLVSASLTLNLNPVTINMPNIASSSAAQTGTVCRGTAGLLTYDTTTTCLLSSMTVKHDWHTLKGALSEVMALNPVDFLYNDQETVPGRQIGFLAEEVALVDPRLVATGADRPPGVRYTQITALLAAAIQEQEARLASIEARLH